MPEIRMRISADDNATPPINKVTEAIKKTGEAAKDAKVKLEGLGAIKLNALFEVINKGVEFTKKIFETASKLSPEFDKTVKDMSASFSKGLQPALLNVTKQMTDFFNSREGAETLKNIINGIGQAINLASNYIGVLLNSLKQGLEPVVKNISSTLSDFSKNMTNSESSTRLLSTAITAVSGGLQIAGVILAEWIKSVGNYVKLVKEVGGFIASFFEAIEKKDPKKITEALGKVGASFEKLVEDGKSGFGNITKVIDETINNFSGNLNKLENKIKEGNNNLYKDTAGTTTKIIDDITKREQEIQRLIDAEIAMWDDWQKKQEEIKEKNTINVIKGMITSAINAITTNFQEMENTTNAVFSSISSGIGNFSKDVLNVVQKIIDKDIGGIVASGIQTIGNGINSIFSALSGEAKRNLKQIENDYKNTISMLEQEEAKRIEMIQNNGKTELELLQQKYNDALVMQENYQSDSQSLRENQLNDYIATLTTQTDEDIKQAVEKKRAEIAKTEAVKQSAKSEELSQLQKEINIRKTQDEYNAKKVAAEKEYNKQKNEIEKKAFENAKAMQIANVWISAAIGVASAWAAAASAASAAGPAAGAVFGITGGILTGIILTNAGIQTGLIASQQYQPQGFQMGGGVGTSRDILVGETGREILRVPVGSQVITNDTTERIIDQGRTDVINNIYLDGLLIARNIVEGRKGAYAR